MISNFFCFSDLTLRRGANQKTRIIALPPFFIFQPKKFSFQSSFKLGRIATCTIRVFSLPRQPQLQPDIAVSAHFIILIKIFRILHLHKAHVQIIFLTVQSTSRIFLLMRLKQKSKSSFVIFETSSNQGSML
jgi:hypothetical protein